MRRSATAVDGNDSIPANRGTFNQQSKQHYTDIDFISIRYKSPCRSTLKPSFRKSSPVRRAKILRQVTKEVRHVGQLSLRWATQSRCLEAVWSPLRQHAALALHTLLA